MGGLVDGADLGPEGDALAVGREAREVGDVAVGLERRRVARRRGLVPVLSGLALLAERRVLAVGGRAVLRRRGAGVAGRDEHGVAAEVRERGGAPKSRGATRARSPGSARSCARRGRRRASSRTSAGTPSRTRRRATRRGAS